MDGAQFAAHCDELRKELVRDFTNPASGSAVAARIDALGLDHAQSRQLAALLDTVVRDTVYTLLLALDGAASLGSDLGNATAHGPGADDGDLCVDGFHGWNYRPVVCSFGVTCRTVPSLILCQTGGANSPNKN